MPPSKQPDERVLIIAPVGQDSAAMADLLAQKGCETLICRTPVEGARLVVEGAGVLLMTEEALELPEISILIESLQTQPPWSELPVVALMSGGESRTARLLNLMAKAAGGVIVLERPMRVATLWRTVEVALRSRRRQYQVRDLLEGNSRLAAIVQFSEDAIISKDLNGIIHSWNAGAERLFGYTAQEAIGQPVTMLIPPDRLEEEPKILARMRAGEAIQHFETIRARKDGTRMDISLTISPLRDERGQIVGVSKIARDITERIRVEEGLRQAQAELRQHAMNLEKTVADRTVELRAINEQLEAFVYSIAHDLRAPLRSMIYYPELLITEHATGLDDTAQDMLRRLQRASQFMDKLLMDLLEYGRTARGEIPLMPMQVQQAWKNAMFQCGNEIKTSGAEVETIEPLPTVRAHGATLGQCLTNLLSNALKFVAPGRRPHVRFWAEERKGSVRLWVEDNGIGIPENQQERVFQVFERVHGTRYPGTGIGLSIVRKGVERMGGRMGLESKPGVGTRFWIELVKGMPMTNGK